MEKEYYVLGIGASSGALQSLSEFFNTLDATLPFAIVLVTHLQLDSRRHLEDILLKKTRMKVRRLDRDMPITKGIVYILDEQLSVTIEEAMLCVRIKQGDTNNTIDTFLISLAENFKEQAIGIILSGTGRDGLEGAKTIGAKGGKVLVQEPFSALYQSLPRLIIKGDHPDKILPAASLASWLNRKYGVVKDSGSSEMRA